MAELQPCRVCGVVPEFGVRHGVLAEHVYLRHECETHYSLTADLAAAEWNEAQASPALAAIRAAVEAERDAWLGLIVATARNHEPYDPADTVGKAVRAARAALDALLGGGETTNDPARRSEAGPVAVGSSDPQGDQVRRS